MDWAGGHGLHFTPRDYLTFQRALLAGGTFNGITILEESTVDAAFTNQIGDLDFPEIIAAADPATTEAFEAGPDHKWGYGLLLNTYDIPGRATGRQRGLGRVAQHPFLDRSHGRDHRWHLHPVPALRDPRSHGDVPGFRDAVYASR